MTIKNTSRRFIFTFFSVALLTACTLAYAEVPTSPSYDDGGGGVDMGRKLGRGIANVAFGWVDIFNGIKEVHEQNNTIAAITWGPIYGFGKAIRRTAAGAAEVVTFPIKTSKYNEPLVEPEFVLDTNQ